MERTALWCIAASVLMCAAIPAQIRADVEWEDISRGHVEASAVLTRPGVIYMGARGGVFVSRDNASSWRNILSLKGGRGRVNMLLADPKNKDGLYAATSGGLFYSGNGGASWQRLHKGRNDLQENCTALLAGDDGIFLGTSEGLFVSADKGRSWHKETGKLGGSAILAIVSIPDKSGGLIFAAAGEGVFRMRPADKTWERVFIPVFRSDPDGTDDDQDTDGPSDKGQSSIRYLAASNKAPACLYLATSRGIYAGIDGDGQAWQMLSDYGLLSRDVEFILVTDAQEVYAATRSGIFKYTGKRWEELSLALSAQQTRYLAVDNKGGLYAACDRGLFRAQRRGPVVHNEAAPTEASEPGIEEVQKQAVKYAEVCPEKIKLWRRQAAASAILPTFTAAVKRDTSDLWHWESGSTTRAGDDILTKGTDAIGWDVRLSWDLSQLIWNPAQTSIDVRSRLMVDLRNDILDEVTKIYFERLRVKRELNELGIEDRKKRAEKELRFRELTAMLDGFTGGYFSRMSG